MLPVLTDLVPRLKPHLNAWLTHNIMLATPLYKQAAHYTYASTLLPPGPLTEALLGAECVWGAVWTSDIAWRRSEQSLTAAGTPVEFDGTITPTNLCAWLIALAARIAMPTPREYAISTHHYPAALPLWWRVVETVARRVPPHWIAGAVQTVLSSKRSCARGPRCAICVNEPLTMLTKCTWACATSKTDDWDLGAAGAEMDALAAMWAPRLPLPLSARYMAAADAACEGGRAVLFQLPVGAFHNQSHLRLDEAAQARKLGVVLLHPAELAARAARRWQHGRPQSFADVPRKRGAPAQSGERVQLFSAARWVELNDDAEISAEALGRGSAPSNQTEPLPGAVLALQIWVTEQRLGLMMAEGWSAHAVSTDTGLALTMAAAPLQTGKVVRKL